MELQIMNLLWVQMIFVPTHPIGREYPDEKGTRSHAHKWCSQGKIGIIIWPYPARFAIALKFSEVVFPGWLGPLAGQL